jgi:hypothetical protein
LMHRKTSCKSLDVADMPEPRRDQMAFNEFQSAAQIAKNDSGFSRQIRY